MLKIFYVVSSGLAACLCFYIWYRGGSHRRRRRAERVYGCKDPVQYPHTDHIRGSDLTTLRKKALGEGRLVRLYVEQHRRLGETWQEKVDGKVQINTISGPNFRYMYAQHMSQFVRAGPISRAAYDLFGKGAFLADGEEWRVTRRSVEPIFSKYETGTMPMLKTHVDRFMEGIPEEGVSFDAQPLIKRMFLDLATEFLFGEPLGLQLPKKREEGEEFLRTLDSCLLGINKRRQGFSMSSIKLWFDGSYHRDVAKVHTFIDSRITAAKERTQHPSINEKFQPSRHILADGLTKQFQDTQYLRSVMLTCFIPGRDSPAILTSNCLFALSRHSEYWSRLRTTALAVPDSDLLSFSVLSSLHPIRNVVLESLRFHGPGGGNGRFAAQDVILPEGGGPDGKRPLFVPKGTRVQTHLLAMHRNKRYWGEDADVWRPERFVNHAFSDWEFRPFLAGPRTCPAKDQVLTQVTYILARLLREWEGIECKDEVDEFVEMTRLTTESRRGARIALLRKVKHSI